MDGPDRSPPGQRPVDRSVESVPLDLDEGDDAVVVQENRGRQQMAGGGEWPDPATPPSDAAPGGAGIPTGPSRHRDVGSNREDGGAEADTDPPEGFAEVYRRVDDEQAASGA